MIRLGERDRRVIRSFVKGEPNHDGHKLDTDGRRLDGLWMGGRGISERSPAGKLAFPDLGSRTAQMVQRAVAIAWLGPRKKRPRGKGRG